MSGFGSISEAAYLAIYSLILLVKSEKSMNTVVIAEKLNASKHHVSKVLNLLHQKEYLESSRGPNGGYSLRLPAHKISFLEIYELVSGKIEISACSFNRDGCPFEQCVFDHKVNQLKKEFKDFLAQKDFGQFLEKEASIELKN
jgi:Rrf2 family protein